MSSIIIVGDPHLGGGSNQAKQVVGSVINSRVVDQLNLLDWVYEKAVKHNVRHIIITGDVFDDPKPHYNLISIFLEWLTKCSQYNINVHIIVGNHDILRSGQFTTSPLDVISTIELIGVHVYKRITTLHLEDISITFLPFRDRRSFNTDSNSTAINILYDQLRYELKTIDKNATKIIVGHLALDGAIPIGNELDELTNELFCPFDMFQGYDYVWMGHVHKFQILSQKPYLAHIGSMDISDFGEVEHNKYIAMFDPNQNDKLPIYFQLPTRQLNHIKINIPDTEINISKFIEDRINELGNLDSQIVKVSIVLPTNSSYSADRIIIEKQLYQAGAFYVLKISEERKFASIKKNVAIMHAIDNNITELSAIKAFASSVDESLRDEFITTASAIVKEYKESSKI